MASETASTVGADDDTTHVFDGAFAVFFAFSWISSAFTACHIGVRGARRQSAPTSFLV